MEITLLEKLITVGGQAGLLYVAIWFLAKTIKNAHDARISDYDGRIAALERRSDQCEADRAALHLELRVMQSERFGLLERLLSERLQGQPPM